MAFLLLSIGLVGLVCAAVLIAVVRRSFLGWVDGISDWAWACGLMLAAALLFGEGATRSVGIVRILANVTLFVAIFEMYVSLCKLADVASAYRALGGLVAVAAATLAWMTFAHDDYISRALCVVIVHFVLFAASAQIVLQMKSRRFAEHLTLLMLVFLACVSLVRVIAIVADYEHSDVLEAATVYQKIYLLMFGGGVVALIVSYMLLVGTRLLETLKRLHSFASMDNVDSSDRRELSGDLHHALQNAEFVLFFQPRVAIQSGLIIGVEALLRWNHPTRGMLLPHEFIPICEETDAILEIGEWVLERSCEVLNRLHREGGFRINMSVNVSAKQIRSDALPDCIERLIANAAFKPVQLELELTESLVIRGQAGAGKTIERLKALGVHVAIDDFGTGYSSLAYIRDWPVDCVKIDRTFVSGIPEDPGCVAITRAIVAMGQALGLKVVAEGVETTEQLAYLRDAGCDEYQGYLASEALPEEELLPLLASWGPHIASDKRAINPSVIYAG
jgi:EAL domain-containing protein (putative c-di-GMP-specific phosphodiesterase class I)